MLRTNQPVAVLRLRTGIVTRVPTRIICYKRDTIVFTPFDEQHPE